MCKGRAHALRLFSTAIVFTIPSIPEAAPSADSSCIETIRATDTLLSTPHRSIEYVREAVRDSEPLVVNEMISLEGKTYMRLSGRYVETRRYGRRSYDEVSRKAQRC
jgi:hypothetical protein